MRTTLPRPPIRETMMGPPVRLRYALIKPVTGVVGDSAIARAYRYLRNECGEYATRALALARARSAVEAMGGVHWYWDPDCDGCIGCDCGSADCACAAGTPHDVEWCRIVVDDVCFASLGSICDASPAYRYVVECELASEALDRIREHVDTYAETYGDNADDTGV